MPNALLYQHAAYIPITLMMIVTIITIITIVIKLTITIIITIIITKDQT